MNEEEALSAFYDRVYEIVDNHPREAWDDLIVEAFPETIELTGDIINTIEAICGGDCLEVENP